MILTQTLQARSVIGSTPGDSRAWDEAMLFFEYCRVPGMGVVQDWRHPIAWNGWVAISVVIP